MKYHIIFAIGFFLTIIPFIGIPTSWKLLIVGTIGACLMAAALIRYYTDYSSQEYGQTHIDGGPEDNNEPKDNTPSEEIKEEPEPEPEKEMVKEKITEVMSGEDGAHFSPYYSPEKIPERKIVRTKRVKKVEEEERSESSDDEDDEDEESYIAKNKYEEEHSF